MGKWNDDKLRQKEDFLFSLQTHHSNIPVFQYSITAQKTHSDARIFYSVTERI